MGVSAKAAKNKQHWRTQRSNMSEYANERASAERNPVSTDEVVCKHCKFKARYQFIRCPECSKLQDQ